MKLSCPVVLASASPRRKKLLQQIGFSFEIHASNVDESFEDSLSPSEIVQYLAEKKSQKIAAQYPERLTISADTIVVLDNEILGKPSDEEEAKEMLKKLSGKKHNVYTGIALNHPQSNRFVSNFARTEVCFADLDDQEINSYVATGSPMDKAGAYGIQDDIGSLFISYIHGDFYNVVGLPLHTLYSTLKSNFDDLLII